MNKPYVSAMRIYLKDGYKPMADLAILENGELVRLETIEYDDINKRENTIRQSELLQLRKKMKFICT